MIKKDYVFANWGERVSVIDGAGKPREGIITEFDVEDEERNTKVMYKGGGYDWFNRDEVEQSMIAREQVIIDENQSNNL